MKLINSIKDWYENWCEDRQDRKLLKSKYFRELDRKLEKGEYKIISYKEYKERKENDLKSDGK